MNIFVLLLSSTGFSVGFLIIQHFFDIPIQKLKLLDIKNRIVSFIHGLFCIWFSSKCLLEDYELGSPTTSFQDTVITISVGYYIYDTIAMLAYDLYNWSILLHHFMSVCFITVILQTNYGGVEIVWIYFLGEITNPLLQIKCFLKALDQQNTRLYLLVEITYLVCFLIIRIGIGMPFLVAVILSHKVGIYSKAAFICGSALNIHWAIDMIGVLNLRRKQFLLRQVQGVSLPWSRPLKKDF